MPGRVFAVDDQPEVLALLRDLMCKQGRRCEAFADGEQALRAIADASAEVDLLVLDLDLGPGKRNGMEILREVRSLYPKLPVVILTGKGSVDDAVLSIRLGATDFIEKDIRLGDRIELTMGKVDRLLQVLRDHRKLERECQLLRERAGLFAEMIGAQAGLSEVATKIAKLADIPRPVLILGERGTGKELVAHALHRAGARRACPFVTVNCAAIPEQLAEAELFGHEKGAFTDAREGRPGRFELADSGTLFLDEISNMPAAVQKKILRAIEYQSFERVRGAESIRVDVRVIAATNADLETEMKAGRFRRDLYDRLAFDVVRVPPLRERRQDIPALCRHFISHFRTEVAAVTCRDICDSALEKLRTHPFPGNVRELRNLIERAAYRCQGDSIAAADLELPAVADDEELDGGFAPQVRTFERRLLSRAIERAEGNLATAAKALNLSYDQMRRLNNKYRKGSE